MDAGKLTALVSFQKKGPGDDGYGNMIEGNGSWAEVFKAWGRSVVDRASERVIGSQQIGNVVRNIEVRSDPDTVLVDNSYRILILNEAVPIPMNVISANDIRNEGKWITVNAVQGDGE